VFTHLSHVQGLTETEAGLSSLMDAWILLLNREANGEFNRELYLLKARGISHSNQVREFVMSTNGIRLIQPYLGDGVALTGSARRSEESRVRRDEIRRKSEVSHLQEQISHRRRRARAQMEALKAELDADEVELQRLIDSEADYLRQAGADASAIAKSRGSIS
jgi:circadian clock protein KaiC